MTDQDDKFKRTLSMFEPANTSPYRSAAERAITPNIPVGTEIIYSKEHEGKYESVMVLNRELWSSYPFLVHEGDNVFNSPITAVITAAKTAGDYTRWSMWRAPRDHELMSTASIDTAAIRAQRFVVDRPGDGRVGLWLRVINQDVRDGAVTDDVSRKLCVGTPYWKWAAWECLVCHQVVVVHSEPFRVNPQQGLYPCADHTDNKCRLNIGNCDWELVYGPDLPQWYI